MPSVSVLICSSGSYEDTTERNITVFKKYEDADKEMVRLNVIADRLNDEWNAVDFHNRIEEAVKEQEVVREKYRKELQDEYFKYNCIDGNVHYMIDVVSFVNGE